MSKETQRRLRFVRKSGDPGCCTTKTWNAVTKSRFCGSWMERSTHVSPLLRGARDAEPVPMFRGAKKLPNIRGLKKGQKEMWDLILRRQVIHNDLMDVHEYFCRHLHSGVKHYAVRRYFKNCIRCIGDVADNTPQYNVT